MWETTYTHVLRGPDPVFTWVSGTGARPTLQALPDDLRASFEAEFKRRLAAAYPVRADGTVLLPFRRVFAVAQVGCRMRLHHVQVSCPRGGEDDARRFYGEGLGLTEVEKPAGLAGRGGAWFRAYDESGAVAAELHVGVEEPFRPGPQGAPGVPARLRGRRWRTSWAGWSGWASRSTAVSGTRSRGTGGCMRGTHTATGSNCWPDLHATSLETVTARLTRR